MGWVTLAVAYVVVGLGVYVWCVRGNATQDPDQKKRSAKVLVLFPELCLLWPVALLLEVRRKRTVKKAVEDGALARAIQAGEDSPLVDRSKVIEALERES